jgi:hypothetical protein
LTLEEVVLQIFSQTYYLKLTKATPPDKSRSTEETGAGAVSGTAAAYQTGLISTSLYPAPLAPHMKKKREGDVSKHTEDELWIQTLGIQHVSSQEPAPDKNPLGWLISML